MSVANVVMFEFETKADLENWADWYKNDGPFPNNEISLFVQTGETSAFGIATYPSEEAREAGGKIRDDLHNNSDISIQKSSNLGTHIPVLSHSGPIHVSLIASGSLT